MIGRPHARWLPAVLVVSACAPDPPCGLRLCDIRDAECQRVTAEGAACLRGVEPVTVPVALVSRDTFVADAAATTLTPAEEEAFRRWNAGLAALGLAPIDNSPGADGAARATWLGGFYSSQDKQITIIEDGRPLDSWPFIALLVHEYVHAIQDVRFDLAQLSATHVTDLDRALGVGAVIEGDATYIGDLASAGFFGVGINEIPWAEMFARWQDNARHDARRSPLPVTLAPSHFRYPFGTAFTKAALDASGWTGVDGLFALPPSGTREVMAGFGAAEPTGGAWAEDLGADAVPILDERFAYVGADRMGAWLLQVFLDRVAPYSYGAADLPPSLRGDALSIFHDQITGGAVAFWRLRLASIETSDVLSVATSMLPAARRNFTEGDDLVIVAASDAATLDAVPTFAFYQPIPPGTAPAAPLAGRLGHGCLLPVQ